MKKKIVVSSAIASTLTASTLTTSITLVNQFSKKVLYRQELDQDYDQNWCEELGAKKFKIKNHKGMYLQAYMIEKESAKRTVVCLHDFLQASYSLKKTVIYLQKNFEDANIMLYDANAHGLSDGYIRGFGYRDIFDLMYFNTYLLQKYGSEHRIIMYGKGMGANTILNTAGLGKLKNVDCILSEGAYDDVYHYLAQLCYENTKIPAYICGPIIRRIIKKELKSDIKNMDTVKMVKKITIPTVYIHSKDDNNVPFKNVFVLYNKTSALKMLFPIKDKYLYELEGKEDSYLSSLFEFISENLM